MVLSEVLYWAQLYFRRIIHTCQTSSSGIVMLQPFEFFDSKVGYAEPDRADLKIMAVILVVSSPCKGNLGIK